MRNKSSYHMYNMTDKTFFKIIFEGFYYIENNEIFWERNAVFVGNGIAGSMVSTFPISDGKNFFDAHAWDWKRPGTSFDFKDYGKTWSRNRKDLEKLIKAS